MGMATLATGGFVWGMLPLGVVESTNTPITSCALLRTSAFAIYAQRPLK